MGNALPRSHLQILSRVSEGYICGGESRKGDQWGLACAAHSKRAGAEASEPESTPEFVEEAEEEKDVEVRSGEPPGLDNIFEFLTEMATRLEDLSATQKEERVPRKKEKQERMERMARMEKSGKAAKERPKRAPSNLLNLMSRRVSAPDKEERSSCLRGVVGLGERSDRKRMARREKEGRRWK